MPPINRRNDWPTLVDETVKLTIVARAAARELDDLQYPFDGEAHSTRIAISTRVGYAYAFLKSIFADPTDPMWFARGVVERWEYRRKDYAILRVRWDRGQDFPPLVNRANLARVGPNLKFCGR